MTSLEIEILMQESALNSAKLYEAKKIRALNYARNEREEAGRAVIASMNALEAMRAEFLRRAGT